MPIVYHLNGSKRWISNKYEACTPYTECISTYLLNTSNTCTHQSNIMVIQCPNLSATNSSRRQKKRRHWFLVKVTSLIRFHLSTVFLDTACWIRPPQTFKGINLNKSKVSDNHDEAWTYYCQDQSSRYLFSLKRSCVQTSTYQRTQWIVLLW